MSLIRWEPARELSSLQGEMNRLFDTFFDTSPTAGRSVRNRWIPAMDLIEQEEAYVLRADLPGMDEDDIAIEVDGDVLSISGERRHEAEHEGTGYVRLERSTGTFRRMLTLPDHIDGDAIRATFDRGVLEVHIPKPAERKPRRISIGGSEPAAIEGSAT
jgi:HSP20 family protein